MIETGNRRRRVCSGVFQSRGKSMGREVVVVGGVRTAIGKKAFTKRGTLRFARRKTNRHGV